MTEPRLTGREKEAVIQNAGGICEYCRSRQDHSPDPFSVEHIQPRARGGSDASDNLALSCQGFNGIKHTKTEAVDPVSHERAPLFHPRKQEWREHFEWNDDFTIVVGLTDSGRATVAALQLNRLALVNLRRVLYAFGLHPPEDEDE